MSEFKNYSKSSWRGLIFVILFFLALIFIFFYVDINKSIIYIFSFVLLFLVVSHKELLLSNTYIIIKYPFLPFIKYKFLLNEIEKIQIVYLGGKASQEAFKINLKSGKRKKFNLTLHSEYKEFIFDLRRKNIHVDTSRHPKLK